jgi:hypothetical protein
MSPEREIAYRLDPVLWVREVLGVVPTKWQETFLRAPRGAFIMVLTARQIGKTTVAAWAIAHAMMFYPGSLSVIACPAQRQSAEGVRRIRHILLNAGAEFKSENVYALELKNGSRVLALPGDDETIRGLTVDGWIVADEAARLNEDLITALHPMRARQPQARFAMLSTAWRRTDPFWTAWSSDNSNIMRLKATADSNDVPFTKQFLEEQLQLLGEQDFKQEYLGIPGGGLDSPFSWTLYELATQIHDPLLPPGAAFRPPVASPPTPVAFNPDDPATWLLKYPVIAHDVGRSNDRSTAVVGGTIAYRPGVLGVQQIIELSRNCYGSELVSELAVVDRAYNNDALIIADLTNDPSYAEALFDMFGNRIIGIHIGPHGDGTKFELRPVRNSAIPVYNVGRTYLFDRLLGDFRSRQIRFTEEPMARRIYEQLNDLEVEQKETGKIYKCLPGKHDDLGISGAMLNWAIRHPHFVSWGRHIDAQHRPRPQRQKYGMKSFVVG